MATKVNNQIAKTLFRLFLGLTGLSEAVLGLAIVVFATDLQAFLAPDTLQEPLYLRIIGMMDFWIGCLYVSIALNPIRREQLNKTTSFLRLGLCAIFIVEGVWLLELPDLRLLYQFLGAFDLSLFLVQTVGFNQIFKRDKS